MATETPFFQAFGPLLFGRSAPRLMRKLGRVNSLQELYDLFGHLVPEHLLAASEKGPNSRERVFSTQVSFWAFAAQILSPGTACREIIRRVEAWWQETFGDEQTPSTSTSAYCQARGAQLAFGQVVGRIDPGMVQESKEVMPVCASAGAQTLPTDRARPGRFEGNLRGQVQGPQLAFPGGGREALLLGRHGQGRLQQVLARAGGAVSRKPKAVLAVMGRK